MVAAALAAGAAAGAKGTAKQAVSDAYTALKGLITRRYGVIEADVVAVENDPEEPHGLQLLARKLTEAGAADDREVRDAAEQLWRAVTAHAPAAADAAAVRLRHVKAGEDIDIKHIDGPVHVDHAAADGSIRISKVQGGGAGEDPSTAPE